MNDKKQKRSMSMKTKWIITGVLCVLAVLTVVLVAADGCFDFKPGSVKPNNAEAAESAAPVEEAGDVADSSTYRVLVTAGNGGKTDPSGSVTINAWGSVTINITPDEGYEIQSVTVDGENKGAVSSYTLQNIVADHSVIATFVKKVEPTPTPTPTPSADVEPDDGDGDE